MADLPTTQESGLVSALIDGLSIGFPDHLAGTRPIHSIGVAARGFFQGTKIAQQYCISPQFSRDQTLVTVRFSNGNGSPFPDATRQVRGMAVKFHLGNHEMDGHGQVISDFDTDLVMMSVPMFMAATPDKMLEFEEAYAPRKVHGPTLIDRIKAAAKMYQLQPPDPGVTKSGDAGIIAFSQRYQPAQAFVVANSMLKVPTSYCRTAFHAVHAFDCEGSDGLHRFGRFTFEPADGVREIPTVSISRDPLPDDYLRRELSHRFASRFNLRLQLSDPWDDTSDPTVVWPLNRKRILMGTLRIYDIAVSQDECESLSFNPTRLVHGMSLSDDPLLAARREIYNESQRRRGAKLCPVLQSTN